MKEREEMWQKIEELARLNPQVRDNRTWDKRGKNVLGVLTCFLSPREQVLASELSPVDTAAAVACLSQKIVSWNVGSVFIRLSLCSTDL